MTKIKKSITIDEELDKKLQELHKKNGSTDSGVINIALREYLKKKK